MTSSNDSIQLKLLEVREQIQKHLNSSVLETSLFNPLISPGPASITLLQCDIPSNNIIKNNQHFKIKEYTHINSKSYVQNRRVSHSNSINGSNPFSSTSSNISDHLNGNTTSIVSSSDISENMKHDNGNNSSNNSINNNNNNSNDSRKGLVAAAALTVAVTNPFPSRTKHSNVSKVDTKNHTTLKNDKISKSSYILPKQTNILTCKCGVNGNLIDMKDDKKLLIQCHRCNRWQHMRCYGLTNKLEILPIKFYCDVCQPGLKIKDYKVSKKNIDKKKKLKYNNNNNNYNSNSNSNSNMISFNATGGIVSDESDFKNTASQTELDVATQLTKIRDSFPYLCQRKPPKSNQRNAVESSPLLQSSEKLNTGSNSINNILFNGSSGVKDNSDLSSFVPTLRSIYKDKYVQGFVNDHNNDDWVVQMNKQLNLPFEKDIIYSRSILTQQRIDSTQSMKGVFAKRDINKDDMITELIGEVDFQRNYIVDPANQYRILGTTQPKVFFHPHWPIYIDTRNATSIYKDNNFSMVIKELRRSCQPNVELKTVRTPTSAKDDCGIHFVVVATRDIKKDEELLIKWQWDLRHPVCQIIDGNQVFDNLSDMDKYWLIHCIDTIWQSSPCACHFKKEENTCLLLKIKKYAEEFHQVLKAQTNKQTIDKLHV